MAKKYGARTRAPKQREEYWDTCVFLDLLKARDDARGEIARALWDDARNKGRIIYTSDLTIAEVAFVLDQNATSLDAQEEADIEALWSDDKTPVRFVSITQNIARKARAIKRACMNHKPKPIPLEPFDALHLACAQHAQVQTVFTTDKFNRKRRETSPSLPDQRPALGKLIGIHICDPKASGIITFPNPPKSRAVKRSGDAARPRR